MSRKNPHLDEGVTIGNVRIVQLTDKALLVELPADSEYIVGIKRDKWLPKSQLHESSEIKDYAVVDETGELVIADWLAKKWAEEAA